MTAPASSTGGAAQGRSPVEDSRARGAPLVEGRLSFEHRLVDDREESFSPTRSARTPLVVDSRARLRARLEVQGTLTRPPRRRGLTGRRLQRCWEPPVQGGSFDDSTEGGIT